MAGFFDDALSAGEIGWPPNERLNKPRVITLCGSTRFKAAFINWLERLTDDGHIVLSVGRFLPRHHHETDHKAKLDELHLRKIDLSDEIFVLNVRGYIGDSTAREIAYARKTGKAVRYLTDIEPSYEEPPLSETDIGRAVLGTPADTTPANPLESHG